MGAGPRAANIESALAEDFYLLLYFENTLIAVLRNERCEIAVAGVLALLKFVRNPLLTETVPVPPPIERIAEALSMTL